MAGIIVFISVFVRARNFQMPRMTIFVQIRLIGLRVFLEIIYYIYQ
jgi:hypothetical protein